MAKRILPYRDYSEHDVVNLFSLHVNYDKDTPANSDNLTEWVEAVNGKWDSGVVVKVKTGELPGDMYNTESGLSEHNSGEVLRKYLGASPTSAHIGYNAYPYNGMTVEPAGAGDVAVGITLRETLAYDENGEKLLYYKQKLDEAQAVLPGQTVPVLTRGLVLLSSTAFDAYNHDPSTDPDGSGTPDTTNITIGAKIYVGPNGTLSTEESGDSVGSVVAKSGTNKVLCKISF
jgi:hypothetical protein